MYLNIAEVFSKTALLAEQFPEVATDSVLPHSTAGDRRLHMLKISAGPKAQRHGLYIQAGIHANEWGMVDAVLFFAEQLLISIRDHSDVRLGGRTFAAADIAAAMARVEIFIVPCVNPDGRSFTMEAGNDEAGLPKTMWRKNRRDNGDPDCFGVDLNRNFDWIWDYRTLTNPDSWIEADHHCQGVMEVSDAHCDPIYHGTKPFSEPEAQNVKEVLDENRNIRVFVDLHGIMGKVMTPWADDEVQTTDPEQNFLNPAFDGKRGLTSGVHPFSGCPAASTTLNPDGAVYQEFMHVADRDRYQTFAQLQSDAIKTVRNVTYRTGTSFLEMYGMSGNANDYAYSRHIADPALSKIDGYIYEFQPIAGPANFQPPFENPPGPTDMIHVIHDVTAGLIELMLNVDRIAIVDFNPRVIDFGRVRVGTSTTRAIGLLNRGPHAVDIHSVAMLGEPGPFSTHPTLVHLEPGALAEMPVVFAPTAAGPASGRVAIEFSRHNESVHDVRIARCSGDACTAPRDACVAPAFEAHGAFTCLLQAIVFGAMIIALALFAWIPSVLCTIRQLAFRIRHCREGNPDPCRRL